jgi:hypothetical protein
VSNIIDLPSIFEAYKVRSAVHTCRQELHKCDRICSCRLGSFLIYRNRVRSRVFYRSKHELTKSPSFQSWHHSLVLITLVFRHNESHGIHNELGVIVGRHDTTGDAEKRGAQLDNSASNTTAVDTSPPSDEPMPAKEV